MNTPFKLPVRYDAVLDEIVDAENNPLVEVYNNYYPADKDAIIVYMVCCVNNFGRLLEICEETELFLATNCCKPGFKDRLRTLVDIAHLEEIPTP